MSNIHLLIIDDELGFYGVFRRKHLANYAFEVAGEAGRGLELIKQGGFDAVLLDLCFQGKYSYDEGLHQLLPEAVAFAKGAFPIIIATSDNRKETAPKAVQNGAALLLRKSEYDAVKWDEQIRKAIQDFHAPKISPEIARGEKALLSRDGFLSVAPIMLEIKRRLRKFAEYKEYSVLLLGKPGVGKEVAASYLHQCKENPNFPWVAVNLSALGEKLVESEIFGHIKGAFTDASSDKTGYFEKAKGGTLFLDEIGEVSIDIQVKLLRVLEQKIFQKVGSTTPINLEVQLIFATNRNLEQAVASGLFRQDFYGRIQAHTIHIPPLRERLEDIIPLIDYFWEQSCRKPSNPLYGKKASEHFTEEALQKMHEYEWPGNIRELKNAVEELIFEVDFQEKNIINVDILPDRFKVSYKRYNAMLTTDVSDASDTQKRVDSQIYWPIAKQTAYHELTQIEKALIAAGGRRDEAAQSLGLKNDQALRYKVKMKYHNAFPELFESFPIIRKLYKF